MLIKSVGLVGLGGCIGSILRFLIQTGIGKIFTSDFPLATFIINIVGSFLIAFYYGMAKSKNLAPEWKDVIATGMLGGFTTFSTFSNDNVTLLKQGQFLFAALNIVGSVGLALLAVFLAYSW